MIKHLSPVTALLATLTLTACTVFPIPEPPRIMDLAAPDSQQIFAQAQNASIRIDTPLASAPFEGSQILVKPTPYEFQTIGEIRWRDTAPVMVRDHLVRHLRKSEGFRNIIVDTSPANAELALISELTAFHAIKHNGSLNIVIQLHTEMMSNRQREGLCVRNWTVNEPVGDGQLDSIVQGFSKAANRLNNDLTTWLSDCLDQYHKSSGS
ncbi:ABC-type transport auxiliary lipoprotein family protein [Marinobacter halophilus]|uniref:ABC transporter n=1 Tax=Marinobacter halophilus TaxID=1323740 RepID=A0A2T1KIB3_9GAMM|nr:ABC-type transport auxiliary lipoprotein family protein [Marinobacter halophilus]PSF09463.1 ABC transporter [Marinobacter halophilus]GGC77559.1 hypothetical protein GCM10011362_27670 [Marinobacter halophilus]